METIENGLEVEYMMEYQYPGLLVTEDYWLQRKSADSTVMDRKKSVVSYKPTPAETSNSPSFPSSYEFSQNCGATKNRLQSIASPITDYAMVLGRSTGLANRPADTF